MWRQLGRQLICFMSSNGSGKRYLGRIAESGRRGPDCRNPKWSPDGKFVAYDLYGPKRHDAVGVARADGSGSWKVVPEEGDSSNLVGWTPDGSGLYLLEHVPSRWRSRISLVSRDGTNRQVLAENVNAYQWVVIGSEYLLFKRRPAKDDPQELWSLHTQGDHNEKLLERAPLIHGYGFPADGRRVYFWTQSYSPSKPRLKRKGTRWLWVANVDGTEKRRISQGGMWGQQWLSPSGKHILWITHAEEEREIWTYAFDQSTDPVLVTRFRGLWDVDWLTDETIIFCGRTEPGPFEIWTVSRDGTGLKKILGGD